MTEPVAVAVDANGADQGPAEVARGAAAAVAEGGVRVLLFGPAAQIGEVEAGVEVIDAPVSIAKAEDPARAVRANPDAPTVAGGRAGADGRAGARGAPAPTRGWPAARPAPRWPPRCSGSSAARASTGRRSPCWCRCPARRSCCST